MQAPLHIGREKGNASLDVQFKTSKSLECEDFDVVGRNGKLYLGVALARCKGQQQQNKLQLPSLCVGSQSQDLNNPEVHVEDYGVCIPQPAIPEVLNIILFTITPSQNHVINGCLGASLYIPHIITPIPDWLFIQLVEGILMEVRDKQ